LRNLDKSMCFKPRLKAGSDGEDFKTPGKAFQASTHLKKRKDKCLFEALAGFVGRGIRIEIVQPVCKL
jgi:hypothetical protein